jgi:hypothetical protein
MKTPEVRVAASKLLLAVTVTVTLLVAMAAVPDLAAQVQYRTIHAFHGLRSFPGSDGLISDAAGNLYGSADWDDVNRNGSIFELIANADGTWTKKTLHSFTWYDGEGPRGNLVFDAAGNLYGTTRSGSNYCLGRPGCGMIFKLARNADGNWTNTVINSFSVDGQEGSYPLGGLIIDAAGNLYGTTSLGGFGVTSRFPGFGTVFELTPNLDGTWTEHVLHSFDNWRAEGAHPNSALVLDSAGNLYGTTPNGGKYCRGDCQYGGGTVFQFSPNADGSWSEHILHHFTYGMDGSGPSSRLVFDAAGDLYGTTSGAYSGRNGNVFRLLRNPDGTWTEHVIYQFTGGKDGGAPYAGVTFDAAGNIYGTTTLGGKYGYGVVFKLSPWPKGGYVFHVLHAFRDAPGAYPYTDLVLGAGGQLYGSTNGDATSATFCCTFETVFEVIP